MPTFEVKLREVAGKRIFTLEVPGARSTDLESEFRTFRVTFTLEQMAVLRQERNLLLRRAASESSDPEDILAVSLFMRRWVDSPPPRGSKGDYAPNSTEVTKIGY